MLRLVALIAIAVTALSAQTFEVASVKRSAPETGSGPRSTGAIPGQQEPGRINYQHVYLKSVIALAYRVEIDQVSGPEWLSDERYDILATLPAGASQDQVPAMLQHLLAERFAMTVHEDTRPRTGYALVVGKTAPKLTKSTEKSQPGFVARSGTVTYSKLTMPVFARILGRFTGRTVTDETGIEGEYDLTLNASMADLMAGSVFSAIQDLGLRLETRTAPAKSIVVDKADKIPTGN